MLIWIILLIGSVVTETVKNKMEGMTFSNQEFSFPPNNTPVSKVFVFGRPLYVRQPFVLPQREEEFEQMMGRPEDTSLLQKKRQSTYDMPYQPPPKVEVSPSAYEPEPQPYVQVEPKYPLPQCYTNKAGFMCCNKNLEELIDQVYADLSSKAEWKNCNVQQLANKLQERAEKKFGTDFECLAGIGDFASKAHFYSDLICKTELGGRFIMAYSTPNRHNKKPAAYTEESEPYHTVVL